MGIIATTDGSAASGVITYWRLEGKVKLTRLKEAWLARNMKEDQLPGTPGMSTVLRRALETVAPQGSTIKSLKESEGYTVLKRTDEHDAKQTWRSTMSAWFDAAGRLQVDGADHTAIEQAIDAEADLLHPTDVSPWLVRQAGRCQAVSLREGGGFYFIPAGSDRWEQVRDVLKVVSHHTIYSVPALHSEEAANAVLDALTDEVKITITQLTEALAEVSTSRGVESKIQKCSRVITKLDLYDKALDMRLSFLREAMEEMQAKFVQASMKLDAEKQKEIG